MEDNNWIKAVALGQIGDALEQIQITTEVEESTLDDLDILNKIMNSLRDKQYHSALRLLEGLETTIVNTQILENELELLKQANKAINNHEPANAIEILRGIGSSLLQAEKHTLLGTANVYSNQNNQALTNLQTALEYDPKHFRAISNIGNLELEANNLEQAIVNYEKALQINDSFSSALHNLGVAYRKKGQINKSVSFLKKAQRAKNKELKDEARESMKAGENKAALTYIRYFFFGVTALIIIAIVLRRIL